MYRKLRELPSPGKSRSVFFISGDDRFMIKTVRKEEMNLLLDLIPKYHKHCIENHDTLLTRFFGVHRIKPVTGNQVDHACFLREYSLSRNLWPQLGSHTSGNESLAAKLCGKSTDTTLFACWKVQCIFFERP